MKDDFAVIKCAGTNANVACVDYFHIDENGVYKLIEPDKKSLVCSLIWVDAKIVDVNTGLVKVRIKGLNRISGKIFSFITEMSNLLTGLQNPLYKILVNYGVYISQGENSKVLDYLARQQAPVIYSFDKLGWHYDEGRQLFVLPKKVIGGVDGREYCFAPDSYAPSQDAIAYSGTLEAWQQLVVSECIGNPLLLFALGAAFAAPLMELFHLDGGGINFCGPSSRGKTTLIQIAASVLGHGGDPAQFAHSYIQRWNTTANALEGTALAYNDLLLPMDELGTSNIKNIGQAVYQLSGGKGKAAMNANRDMRTPRFWKTFIVSTGEHAIAQEIEATTGAEARTGQLIRMLDIYIEDNIFPAFPAEQVAERVTALKIACSQQYGCATEPYLQYVVAVANSLLKDDWVQRYALIEKGLIQRYPNLRPEQQRAIKRFTLVAIGLMMANAAGCINVEGKAIKEALLHVLNLWLAEFPTVSEADRGIEHLKQVILSNPGRFVSTTAGVTNGNNLFGFRDNSKERFIILKDKMAEVCGRPNVKPVLRALKDQGYLSHNEGRIDLKWKNVTAYGVYFKLFNDGELEVEPS